jgi:mRNA interferase RelE/StbE
VAKAPYRVELKPAAERDLKKIKDQTALRRIVHAIDGLATNPRPAGAHALQSEDASILRIRVGDYRILYTIEDKALLVLVIRVRHRRDVYRRR